MMAHSRIKQSLSSGTGCLWQSVSPRLTSETCPSSIPLLWCQMEMWGRLWRCSYSSSSPADCLHASFANWASLSQRLAPIAVMATYLSTIRTLKRFLSWKRPYSQQMVTKSQDQPQDIYQITAKQRIMVSRRKRKKKRIDNQMQMM